MINGPNPFTGRVEVYANSTGGLDNAEWGTVCDDNWDIQDARVVCHQLGYPDAVAAPLSAHYGQGTGPILLNDMQYVLELNWISLHVHTIEMVTTAVSTIKMLQLNV